MPGREMRHGSDHFINNILFFTVAFKFIRHKQLSEKAVFTERRFFAQHQQEFTYLGLEYNNDGDDAYVDEILQDIGQYGHSQGLYDKIGQPYHEQSYKDIEGQTAFQEPV